MARITDVRLYHVKVPLHSPWVTSLRRTTHVESLLVEVEDSDGATGWGEGAPVWKVTGDSIPGMRAALSGPLRDAVLDRDPDELDDTCRHLAKAIVGNTTAKAALDIALHDLAARRLAIPVTRLFGSTTLRIPTDVTLVAAPTDDMAKAAAERVAEGFTVLKLKVGEGGIDEVARVHAIRQAAGPGVKLRLDANQGWTPREAVRHINAMCDAGLDVELMEQPVPARDLDGLAYVTANVPIPVLADEAVWSAADLFAVIERRAADMINPKLSKCGGLRPARQLLAVAEAAGVGVMLGSQMETHIGVAAVASLAPLVPGDLIHDLDAAWWLAAAPYPGGPRYDGPHLQLADAPGFGTGPVDPSYVIPS